MFELIHLRTYHEELLNFYCKMVLQLEVTLTLAKQKNREAFSKQEVEDSKDNLNHLQNCQSKVVYMI